MNAVWPLVPLSRVVTPVERAISPVAGTLYRQIGVKLWGEGAYERESIDGGQTQYRTLARTEVNDLVVNKIWARSGSVAVIPEHLAGSYVSSEFPTFCPVQSHIEARWIHWLTKTKSFWDQCDERSRGTSGKNRIRPEQFLAVEIPLPPLDEQRRIVARIEALAGKVEEARGLRRQAVEEAEAFVLSLHSHLAGERVIRLDSIMELDEHQEAIRPGETYPQVGVKSFGKGLFAKQAVADSDTNHWC